MSAGTETTYFAGGCFWGVEHILKSQNGVIDTDVGYIGGQTENPIYQDVCTGETGHAEAVSVVFDPSVVSFYELCDLFFRLHDPTTLNQQGPDQGTQYRSAIFCTNSNQIKTANDLISELTAISAFPDPIMTEVKEAGRYWPAEDLHQDYFDRNSGHLCHVLRPPFLR